MGARPSADADQVEVFFGQHLAVIPVQPNAVFGAQALRSGTGRVDIRPGDKLDLGVAHCPVPGGVNAGNAATTDNPDPIAVHDYSFKEKSSRMARRGLHPVVPEQPLHFFWHGSPHRFRNGHHF